MADFMEVVSKTMPTSRKRVLFLEVKRKMMSASKKRR